MSIFPGHFGAASTPVEGASSRYAVPTRADQALFANVTHRKDTRSPHRVSKAAAIDDGTYEVQIEGPSAAGPYYIDRETLRKLSDGTMEASEVVEIDNETATHFGAQRLAPAVRHRMAQRMAQRRAHLQSSDSSSDQPAHAPAAAYHHGYQMGLAGATKPAQGSASFLAGFTAGAAARTTAGGTVSYGAGALDSAWADITRGTVDSAGATLTCPSSLPTTTDYSRCTCAQLKAKKAYWQTKEWETSLDSAKRKLYGARVNAIAMFEATCDQAKGCAKGVETTDYSKLDCGCLEGKRRYWVDKAGKEVILSGKRELYEAKANHIASFKDTCGQNKASSTSSSSGASASSSASSGTASTSSNPLLKDLNATSSTTLTPTYTASSALAMPAGTYAPVSFSAEQYAESAGASALRALDAYTAGDYVTARQHASVVKSLVDQSTMVGRPFTAGPKVRCVADWAQTGIMGAACIGGTAVAVRPTFAPIVRPGVQVSGPIYSRPMPARPAVIRPPAMPRPMPSLVRPGTSPALTARPGFPALRSAVAGPVPRSSLAFRGLDMGNDVFGGTDDTDIFGLYGSDDAFGADGTGLFSSASLFDEHGA